MYFVSQIEWSDDQFGLPPSVNQSSWHLVVQPVVEKPFQLNRNNQPYVLRIWFAYPVGPKQFSIASKWSPFIIQSLSCKLSWQWQNMNQGSSIYINFIRSTNRKKGVRDSRSQFKQFQEQSIEIHQSKASHVQ